MLPQTRPGPLASVEMVNRDARIWVRIGRWGEVLYDGPGQISGEHAYRDADATPLR